jgi:hypothetical protein
MILAGAVTALGVTHVGKASAMPTRGPVDHAAGKVLGGVTAQNWPVIVSVSSNGKKLSAQVAFDMTCTAGDAWTAPDGWIKVPIPASGTVHAVAAVPPTAGSGGQDSITGGLDTMNGKLNRRGATFSGTWELQLNFTSPSGQPDACDSGLVRFSARL